MQHMVFGWWRRYIPGLADRPVRCVELQRVVVYLL
jgi:hypothetical protein